VEIQEVYGLFIAGALRHFEHDPNFIIDMARSGSLIAMRREAGFQRRGRPRPPRASRTMTGKADAGDGAEAPGRRDG
jgi:hypothetical protein